MNAPGIHCPVCGSLESEESALCGSCGAALAWGIGSCSPPQKAPSPVVATPVEKPTPAVSSDGAREDESTAIPCPGCGHLNEPWAMLCPACSAPLPPRSEHGIAPCIADPVLLLEIHGKSFRCEPGDVLGREGTVAREEFIPVGTVHRRHAQLNVENGEWCLTALASTRNLTEVDGKPVAHGEKIPLRGEHTVRLSTGATLKLTVQQASGNRID